MQIFVSSHLGNVATLSSFGDEDRHIFAQRLLFSSDERMRYTVRTERWSDGADDYVEEDRITFVVDENHPFVLEFSGRPRNVCAIDVVNLGDRGTTAYISAI